MRIKQLVFTVFIVCFLGTRYSHAAIDPKEQMQIILFSGLGGSIMGLSTLSFYDEPHNHLKNIAIGGAVALIGSVVFTTVFAAKASKAELREKNTNAAGVNATGTTNTKPRKETNTQQNTGGAKDGAKDESYFFDDDDDDEDEYMFYPSSDKPYIGIFLADISSNKRLSINPYAVYFAHDTKNNNTAIYGRVLQINF